MRMQTGFTAKRCISISRKNETESNVNSFDSVFFVVVLLAVVFRIHIFHVGFFQATGIDRFHDRIPSVTPAHQVDLLAATTAKRREGGVGICCRRNRFPTNRAIWQTNHIYSDAFFVDSLLGAEPESLFGAESPPDEAFLSASAAFLYESLR
jgi:hypothetical protein